MTPLPVHPGLLSSHFPIDPCPTLPWQSLLLAVHEKLHQEATVYVCQTFGVTMVCDCLANILNVIIKLAEQQDK